MTNGLLVGSKKGLFIIERTNSKPAWHIVKTAFEGIPVTMVLPDQRDGNWYVALNHGHFGVKLHRSVDQGLSWQDCSTPKYPEKPTDVSPSADSNTWSLSQIWSLEQADALQAGTLWAGTLPGGLFKSTDAGESWQLNHALWEYPERKNWMGGGYDQPGIHSICVNSSNKQTITVGVSVGGVWQSTDGGDSWAIAAQGMRAEYMPEEKQYDPHCQDPHRMVNCTSDSDVFWTQHHNGIFVSNDNCKHWREITNVNPSTFGFGVVVHPKDPKTAWFVPAQKDDCRIPVERKVVVTVTHDGGENFHVVSKGLPQEHAYDLVYRHGLDIDNTGTILAMGSTTGGLWLSEEQGESWQCISHHLPPIYCVRFIN